jgi:hypothetical protein
MSTLFRKATRTKVKLRMALDGPAGSGKTFTALRFAHAICPPGKRIAVINSESGAVEKYLGLAPDGVPFDFDVCELTDFAPTKYTEAMFAAGSAGDYGVIIIDSLSHAWSGTGGALELKDKKAASGARGVNDFTAWRDITPMHNQMIESILRSPCHVIATMRNKTEYVMEPDERGRMIPKKVGLSPIQRAGMEYEFDVYGSMDESHILRISKTRCPEITDAMSVKPGAEFMAPVKKWCEDGSDCPPEMFAANEADLRKLMLAKDPSLALSPGGHQGPPKKTAAQLMEEQRKASEAAASAAPAASPTLNTAVEMATSAPVQVAATTFAAQSDAPPDAIGDSAGNGQQLTGVNVVNMAKAKATDDQVATIKRLVNELEQQKPGTAEKFKLRLRESGHQKIADMSMENAAKLIEAIEQKKLKDFFDRLLARNGQQVQPMAMA